MREVVISDIPCGDYLMHDVFYELNERQNSKERSSNKLLEFDASLYSSCVTQSLCVPVAGCHHVASPNLRI